MTFSQVDQQRHAEERGKMLRVLREEYGGQLTTVRSLTGALNLLGYPMSSESVQFSLQYLCDRGYIAVRRAKDQPGYRQDRSNSGRPDAIVSARLLPDGVLLIDGIGKEDPGVTF